MKNLVNLSKLQLLMSMLMVSFEDYKPLLEKTFKFYAFFKGKMEILASAYSSVDKFGNFYVYIMPDDWTQPNWRREIIATNFKANNYLLGNSMTPGKHRIFYPSR